MTTQGEQCQQGGLQSSVDAGRRRRSSPWSHTAPARATASAAPAAGA
jgi:hypothetical protein